MQTKTWIMDTPAGTVTATWPAGQDTGHGDWVVGLAIGDAETVTARIEQDQLHGWGFLFAVNAPGDAHSGVLTTGLFGRFLPCADARRVASEISEVRHGVLDEARATPLYFTVIESSSGAYVLKPSKPPAAIGPYGAESTAYSEIVAVLGDGLPAGRLMPPLRPGQRVEVDMLQWLCKRLWAGRRFSSSR